MRNNKKKGFTLIELIAVIAILAILGAILVPNVLGYRKKAEKSNIQTSAKTIVSAMEAYNSDKDDDKKICYNSADMVDSTKYHDALVQLDKEDLVKLNKIPACLGGTLDGASAQTRTYAEVRGVANGDFSIDKFSGSASTIKEITAVTE